MRRTLAVLLLLPAFDVSGAERKPAKPKLELRAAPRVAIVPGNVIFTAELKGGDDADLRCVTLLWEWGDGSTSEKQEGACSGEVADAAPQRRFTEDREFRTEGRPEVKLTVLKDGTPLARASVRIALQERGKNGLQIDQIR